MKRFNRTLMFVDLDHRSAIHHEDNLTKANVRKSSVTSRSQMRPTSNNSDTSCQRQSGHYSNYLDPMDDTKIHYDYASSPGLSGIFVPIKNDFSVCMVDSCEQDDNEDSQDPDRYHDETHWPREARQKVKRVRFIICTLALFGLALALMSRLILNVSIVEMVRRPDVVPGEDLAHEHETTTLFSNHIISLKTTPITTTPPPTPTTTISSISATDATTTLPPMHSEDPLIYAATHDGTYQETATTTTATTTSTSSAQANSYHLLDYLLDDHHGKQRSVRENATLESNNFTTTTTTIAVEQSPDDGLHFNWSKQDVNIILGAFYIGYAPGILFSGSVAQRYGAKYPLFVCVFGSAIINILTPFIASLSLNALIGSRILLGLIQGSLLPCLYELFSRWLTQTESSIFAPMIKVSMPMGSLMGTIMPGILASFKLEWPNLFYIGGLLCLVWSVCWLLLATSVPQTNRLVGMNELNRIMRKKRNQNSLSQPATITHKTSPGSRLTTNGAKTKGGQGGGTDHAKRSTPWLLIVTNPSVMALTVVKFTYNIGMDFIYLQLAVYLREVHNAPIETISAIASGGYCMQMMLISFVGWLAKIVVIKRAFGLSVTKWRKAFQGGSNFLMALTYLVLAYTSPGLEVASALLLLVCFFWMLGAGGESMVPYDLSREYPASIVGFAHSVSIFSGVALPAACGIILGESTEDPQRWGLLFYLLAGALGLGGAVFVLVVKAKPFLPGEKVPKSARLAPEQQQVASITMSNNHHQQQQQHHHSKLNGNKVW